MKKMLYLMNVNWGWIKQRPHFLAEELSEFYRVEAYYQKHYKKEKGANQSVNLPKNLGLHELFRFPKDEKIGFVKNLNLKLIQRKMNRAVKESNFVWYSKPDHVKWLSPNTNSKVIKIYDCMDDMLSFPHVVKNLDLKNEIMNDEKLLFDNCEIIIASSQNLADKLNLRYGKHKSVHVVNNAMHIYSNKEKYYDSRFESLEEKKKIITYVGTIAEWFEFDKIISALNQTENCILVLFGPSTVEIPSHPKIIHLGTIEHKYVADVLERSSALILPFEVNELIEAVNPVKMYEYISSGNLVIASRYTETLKFDPYSYLYSTEQELVETIINLDSDKLERKQTIENCKKYGEENTWKSRAKEIQNILDNV